MTLEVIYLIRHGFRSNWAVDAQTGQYSSSIPSPTGIASDPALASHGVDQSHQLAVHLKSLDPAIERFFSSPFYRCIQTILPTVEALAVTTDDPETKKIRAENGLGEWYGKARFDHPSPADRAVLKKLFPRLDENYDPIIRPSTDGESIDELHDRVAYALHRIIEFSDKEGVKAIAICTHGATLIAIGRALVGRMPVEVEEQDFHPYTCGLSTFVRKGKENMQTDVKEWNGPHTPIPVVEWRGGNGVGGGWTMVLDGDCSYLKDGEERGWAFSGSEDFPAGKNTDKDQDAGELGIVVQGRSRPASPVLTRKAPESPRTPPRGKKTPVSPLSPSKL
ncbi:phosphoglycerate mutase-like protein [Stipitochalara longipes BDJ]|nr:phosphoglycerate mutase-like protein [Stipitochalara longipes BDJ]